MTRLLLAIAICTAAVSAAASSQAQPPLATILDSVAWDYTQAQITATTVDHFVVCLDATPCITLTLTQAKHPTLGPDVYFWKLPAMAPGNHSTSVVACNLTVCSGQLVIPFRFATAPDPVTNGRVIRG